MFGGNYAPLATYEPLYLDAGFRLVRTNYLPGDTQNRADIIQQAADGITVMRPAS